MSASASPDVGANTAVYPSSSAGASSSRVTSGIVPTRTTAGSGTSNGPRVTYGIDPAAIAGRSYMISWEVPAL
jgi:hypothetical protein